MAKAMRRIDVNRFLESYGRWPLRHRRGDKLKVAGAIDVIKKVHDQPSFDFKRASSQREVPSLADKFSAQHLSYRRRHGREQLVRDSERRRRRE